MFFMSQSRVEYNRWRQILEKVLPVVCDAGNLALSYSLRPGLKIETKSDGSPVTLADRDTESWLRDRLPKVAPGIGVIGEEWGFIGGLFLIGCYFVLVSSSFDLAQRVKDRFGMLLTVGIASILALQVIINIGMVMGAFPIVGITLPMVSYGRTSFVIFMGMIGILLSVARSRLMKQI